MLSGSDEAAAIALERQISTAVEGTRKELNAKLAAQKEEHERALAAIENNRSGKFHKEMTAVVASVRGELEAEANKLRKEIEKLKGERDQAQMQLADVQNEHSHCKSAGEHAAVHAQVENELSRLREELSHAQQLVTEYEQLAAEREETNKLLSEALDKQRASVVEGEKAAVQKVRAELDAQLKKALEEQNRLQQELQRISAAADQGVQERQKLERDLEEALEAATARQVQPAVDTVDLEAIRQETTRVEASLQEIIKAIEDPSAELSFVVRKNVERAQLDSYLQGLRFAASGK
jgi:chromosome segregation ATPase